MLQIIQGDITALNVDVIVNAANAQLNAGGGVCGAIFAKAGKIELQQECHSITKGGSIQVGTAVLTNGYNLNKHIIHAVGPIYNDGFHNEALLLESAYTQSMKIAIENQFNSIAFPFISSGIYGYPKIECATVALKTLQKWEAKYPEIEIIMCCFANDDYKLFNDLATNMR